MLLLWILLLIAAVVILKDIYLIIKRICLLRKIGKHIKKHNGSMQYRRDPIASVFRHDGKADVTLQLQNKTIDISVITTPFRRVRYHFDINNKLLEIVMERRYVYMVNPRVPKPTATMDGKYTIRKYKMNFESLNNGDQKYVILNPAPISVSKADGATLATLYDNDDLASGVKVCGSKWFIENIAG